jgi:hypothetical protein
MNKNARTITLGVTLIGLGLLWWLNLWWLLLPGVLAIGGVAAYVQRRAGGRTIEAVQALVWGLGLSLLFLFEFVWPGVLLLAGASLLLRGREFQADETIQTLARRVRRPRVRRASTPLMTTSATSDVEQRASEPVHWQR